MEEPYFSTTNTTDPTTRLAFEMRRVKRQNVCPESLIFML